MTSLPNIDAHPSDVAAALEWAYALANQSPDNPLRGLYLSILRGLRDAADKEARK